MGERPTAAQVRMLRQLRESDERAANLNQSTYAALRHRGWAEDVERYVGREPVLRVYLFARITQSGQRVLESEGDDGG